VNTRSWRNPIISLFVVGWIALFHYETLRLDYLAPLSHCELPKCKFLYPPAGWIMFFQVDRTYGMAEVYGVRGGQRTLIDPHRIFETKAIGYDNIRRNVLIGVLSRSVAPAFCADLHRKFPEYEEFSIVYRSYSDLASSPEESHAQVLYRCR